MPVVAPFLRMKREPDHSRSFLGTDFLFLGGRDIGRLGSRDNQHHVLSARGAIGLGCRDLGRDGMELLYGVQLSPGLR